MVYDRRDNGDGNRLLFDHYGQDRPNIVLVLFDDLGWGQPQCYDAASTLPTPQLNLLATQGMRFTDAHSAAAVCTPTRYGILTGRYPCRIGQFGVLGTWSPPILPTTRLTMPSLLQQGGYDTACIGKWHLGLQWKERGKEIPEIGTRFREGPNDLGFDYFCGYTHAAGIEAITGAGSSHQSYQQGRESTLDDAQSGGMG